LDCLDPHKFHREATTSLHLLQAALVYINTLMLQQVLAEPSVEPPFYIDAALAQLCKKVLRLS
jgi:hypothetical protein